MDGDKAYQNALRAAREVWEPHSLDYRLRDCMDDAQRAWKATPIAERVFDAHGRWIGFSADENWSPTSISPPIFKV